MAAQSPTTPRSGTQSKPRKPFSAGLSHLPDGPHRRNVQKIKHELIHKAKVRNAYAKLKAREPPPPPQWAPTAAFDPAAAEEPASLAPHPSRAHLIEDEVTATATHSDLPIAPTDEQPPPTPGTAAPARSLSSLRRRPRPQVPSSSKADGGVTQPSQRPRSAPKASPFVRETRIAAQRQEEAEKRSERRAKAEAERAQKLADRERRQRAWRKAKRPDKDGKQRLGRESKLLLEKVQRLVGTS